MEKAPDLSVFLPVRGTGCAGGAAAASSNDPELVTNLPVQIATSYPGSPTVEGTGCTGAAAAASGKVDPTEMARAILFQ